MTIEIRNTLKKKNKKKLQHKKAKWENHPSSSQPKWSFFVSLLKGKMFVDFCFVLFFYHRNTMKKKVQFLTCKCYIKLVRILSLCHYTTFLFSYQIFACLSDYYGSNYWSRATIHQMLIFSWRFKEWNNCWFKDRMGVYKYPTKYYISNLCVCLSLCVCVFYFRR